MISTDISQANSDEINNTDETTTDQYKKENDFGGTEYDATGTVSDDLIAKEHKRAVKTDVISAVTSLALSVTPMVISKIKTRNDPIPYNPTGKDFLKLGLYNAIPIIKAIDTMAFNGKLQKTIEEKTPFTLNDIRNVANLIQLYRPVHNIASNYTENMSREAQNLQKIDISGAEKAAALLSTINLVSPYIVYKFTDDNMSFGQKCSSIMPIKMVGNVVRKLAFTNPKVAQVYDVANAAVKVASFGNNTLSNAVRPSQGMSTVNKASSTISNVLNFTSDILGMNKGNINGSYGGYGGRDYMGGQDSRWRY